MVSTVLRISWAIVGVMLFPIAMAVMQALKVPLIPTWACWR